MRINILIEVLCGSICLVCGVWLLDYVMRRERSTKIGLLVQYTRLQVVSVMLTGIGMIILIVAIVSLSNIW